jgi:selenocysteine lyase/cysteine desulfurase
VPGQASGIVAFTLPDEAPARTAARLRAKGVFVVARRGCVRASPHFYNSSEDLERLLHAL